MSDREPPDFQPDQPEKRTRRKRRKNVIRMPANRLVSSGSRTELERSRSGRGEVLEFRSPIESASGEALRIEYEMTIGADKSKETRDLAKNFYLKAIALGPGHLEADKDLLRLAKINLSNILVAEDNLNAAEQYLREVVVC